MKKYLIAVALGLFGMSAFAGVESRPQKMMISQAEFKKLVEMDFDKIVQEMKKDGEYIVPDARSQRIFDRLKAQTIKSYPEARKWNWQFFGDQHSAMNAFGGNYGKVILGANLFDQNIFNDDELAFVIAHEIAHSIRDHAREKHLKDTTTADFIVLSHLHEYEADEIGLVLLHKSGFNTKNSLNSLIKLKNLSDGADMEHGGFDPSHPSMANRYNRVQKKRLMMLGEQQKAKI